MDQEAAAAAVEADADALSLPETVKESFSLPSQGTNGSQITWEITAGSEAAVIGEDGYTVAVTRSETEDMQVTFKATVQMAGQSAEREFTVTVEKLLSSDEFLAAAADQLELVNPDDVRENIYLPQRWK